jgi:hypothetical protein
MMMLYVSLAISFSSLDQGMIECMKSHKPFPK